jgi:hypothetical protein
MVQATVTALVAYYVGPGLFGAIAAALVVLGTTIMLAVKAGSWNRGLRRTS